ncbi:cytochrome b [Croceicoccus sediminis]|uniref:cytochrome b n=1 Tax=Croceicoccus sediminis TaxID=2571150 RepID=UPI001F115D92|nr:cytochrome b [Croceicoccus sediminis]
MTAAVGVERYNAVARFLHWTIAVIIIGNIIGGFFHDALEDVVNVMPLHKSFGLTVLVLSLVRLGWRMAHRAPPLPAHTPAWERGAAHLTHALFYVLMIGLPMTGWLVSSGSKYPLNWFGLFDVPKFGITPDGAIDGFAHEAHEIMGWVAVALIVLHVGAALRHHFVLKDNVLRRMA